MKFELQNYLTSTGANPVEKWFMSLDAQTAQRIHRSLDQLKEGNFTGCKPIADSKIKGVRERRIDFGPGYRVYFGRDGEKLIILLTGATRRVRVEILVGRLNIGKTTRKERRLKMAQTASYDEMILKRIANDKKFAAEVFKGAIVALFEGDYHYGLTSLRDIVKVGMGFQALSQAVGISAQNLHRTLSTRGNPTIKTLGRIVAAISEYNGFRTPSFTIFGDTPRKVPTN